jgi:hypothetical protein
VSLSKHLIARPIVDALTGVPSTLVVDSMDQAIRSVRWEVEGDLADWERIQAEGLFGVTPEVVGSVFGGGFQPQLPLRFTLLFDRSVFDPIALLADDVEDFVDTMRALDDDAPARSPAHWKLLSVMQAVTPRREIGLTTTFWSELHA